MKWSRHNWVIRDSWDTPPASGQFKQTLWPTSGAVACWAAPLVAAVEPTVSPFLPKIIKISRLIRVPGQQFNQPLIVPDR